MEALPRNFYDFNAPEFELGCRLSQFGSVRDIANLGDAIHEGMRVILWPNEDFEMEGILTFCRAEGYWYAKPIKETLGYTD